MWRGLVRQARVLRLRYAAQHQEGGQDLAEYAVTLAMVALLVVAAVLLLRYQVSNTFNDIVQGLTMNGIGS